jgi:hypothetical protein
MADVAVVLPSCRPIDVAPEGDTRLDDPLPELVTLAIDLVMRQVRSAPVHAVQIRAGRQHRLSRRRPAGL